MIYIKIIHVSENILFLMLNVTLIKDIISDMFSSDLNKWKDSLDPLAGVFLYDIVKDPSESNNLASIHPELVAELLKEAEEEIKDAPPQEFGFVSHSILIPKNYKLFGFV